MMGARKERKKPKNDWILVAAASDVLFIFYHPCLQPFFYF
jgi:hypothetical protein